LLLYKILADYADRYASGRFETNYVFIDKMEKISKIGK